jgi:hypothetical protein
MNINLSSGVVDFDDNPIIEKDKPVTLGVLLQRALLSDVDGDARPVKAAEKMPRFDLYLKIKTSATETLNLSPEEVALLDSASRVFGTLIAGQINYFLSDKKLKG